MTASQHTTDPTADVIACDLSALSATERAAHTALAGELFTSAVLATDELPDGYAFHFAADAYPQVAAFVANERRCCPFIAFAIEVAPYHSGLSLRLTGAPAVKAFLQTQFGAL
jgi:hypothetical protein